MKAQVFFALVIFLAFAGCKTTEKAAGVDAEMPPSLQPAALEIAAQESVELQEIAQIAEDAETQEIPEIFEAQEISPPPLLEAAREFSMSEALANPLPFEDGGEIGTAVIPPQAGETDQARQIPPVQTETTPRIPEQSPPARNAPPPAARIQEQPAAQAPEPPPTQTAEAPAAAQEPQREETVEAEESRSPLDAITVSDDIVPSRAVTVYQNQLLIVTYPGAGWIYLGEVDAAGLFLYQGRVPEQHNPRTAATTFTLKAHNQGTSYLHFYREDFLTNTEINDYLEAAVIPPRAEQEISIAAPDYQIGRARAMTAQGGTAREENSQDAQIVRDSNAQNSISQGGAAQNANARNDNIQGAQNQTPPESLEAENRGTRSTTVIQQSAAQEKPDAQIAGPGAAQPLANAPAAIPFEEATAELYELALKAHNAGEQPRALDYINRFLADSNANIDKGLFLKGEILEASSPVQNIKDSYAAYNRLVREFPTSGLWQQAKNRITYFDRFYFSIR